MEPNNRVLRNSHYCHHRKQGMEVRMTKSLTLAGRFHQDRHFLGGHPHPHRKEDYTEEGGNGETGRVNMHFFKVSDIYSKIPIFIEFQYINCLMIRFVNFHFPHLVGLILIIIHISNAQPFYLNVSRKIN